MKVCIALAVYCTFGLQFFVCLEIGWNSIKENFTERPTLVNYVMRTVLVTAAVLLAVAVPTISPFIGVIGAFCFSILGLLIPVSKFTFFIVLLFKIANRFFHFQLKVLIELVTYWDSGFGPCNWIIWKNVLISIFGVMALYFGTKDSIEQIVKLYSPAANAMLEVIATNNTNVFTNATQLLNNATTS